VTGQINTSTNSTRAASSQTASESNNSSTWNSDKVIDASFFDRYVGPQKVQLPPANGLKIKTFRNGICSGDTIRLDVPIGEKRLTPQERTSRITNWLKILRLEKVPKAQEETVHLDITKLVQDDATMQSLSSAFPIYKENNRYFLDCRQRVVFKGTAQDTLSFDLDHLADFFRRERVQPKTVNSMEGQVLVDISNIVREDTIQSLLGKFPYVKRKGEKWILPCEKSVLGPSTSQDKGQHTLPRTLEQFLQGLPFELCGKSVNYLKRGELDSFQFYESSVLNNPLALNQFRNRINELADAAVNVLAYGPTIKKRYFAHLFLKHVGKYVTEVALPVIDNIAGFLQYLGPLVPNLKSLHINSGKVTHNEIQALKHFPTIESLEFFSCSMQGATFDGLPKSLIRLDCANSKMTDSALSGLKSCTKLKELNLKNTSITGATFSELPPSLQKLTCEGCSSLKDQGIAALKFCSNLEELTLQKTLITGATFSGLPPSLKRLNCCQCANLTDTGLLGLKFCSNLEELTLQRTPITGAAFSELPPSLKRLNCCQCANLTDTGLLGLKFCSNLEELTLQNAPITGAAFSDLPSSLKKLDCSLCEMLTDEAIERLRGCTQLEELCISFTPLREPNFALLSPSLKRLSCEYCDDLQDNVLIGLQSCKNLEELHVGHTLFTGATFFFLPRSLKKLNCEWCHNLTEQIFDGLQWLTNLEDLNFSYNKVSGRKFTLLPVSLKKLDASGSGEINDEAVEGISHCIYLKEANFDQTQVTDASLPKLPKTIEILQWSSPESYKYFKMATT
jgi:uncharacterized protein YjbI with pentapeptide repeats